MDNFNRKCVKCGCSPAKDGIKLFRFPKPGVTNLIRCTLWAKYILPDAQYASVELQKKLYSEHRMLCQKHFSDADFTDDTKTKLLRTAVPFDRQEIQFSAVQVQAGPSEPSSTSSKQTPFKDITNTETDSTVTKHVRTALPSDTHELKLAIEVQPGPSKLPSTSTEQTASRDTTNISKETESTETKPVRTALPSDTHELKLAIEVQPGPSKLPTTSTQQIASRDTTNISKETVKKKSEKEQVLHDKCRKYVKKICYLQNRIKGLTRKEILNKIEDDTSIVKLSKKITPTLALLLQGEIRNVKKKLTGRRWTKEEKIVALRIFKRSPTCYRLLRRLFCLPSPGTLKSMLNKVPFGVGLNKPLFKVLRKTVGSQKNKENLYILMFDEMSIKKHFQYNVKEDIIEGYQDHGTQGRSPVAASNALVFMIAGIREKIKQPIAHFFSSGFSTADRLAVLIKEVLNECFQAGINIVATVCDMDGVNRRAYAELGATLEKPYFKFNNKEIITFFDSPHLIKCFRNLFLKYDIEYPTDVSSDNNTGRGVAKWAYIKQFYELDNSNPNFVYAPTLTKDHLNPNTKQKMKVSMACQVLSFSVAGGMYAKIGKGNSRKRQVIRMTHAVPSIFPWTVPDKVKRLKNEEFSFVPSPTLRTYARPKPVAVEGSSKLKMEEVNTAEEIESNQKDGLGTACVSYHSKNVTGTDLNVENDNVTSTVTAQHCHTSNSSNIFSGSSKFINDNHVFLHSNNKVSQNSTTAKLNETKGSSRPTPNLSLNTSTKYDATKDLDLAEETEIMEYKTEIFEEFDINTTFLCSDDAMELENNLEKYNYDQYVTSTGNVQECDLPVPSNTFSDSKKYINDSNLSTHEGNKSFQNCKLISINKSISTSDHFVPNSPSKHFATYDQGFPKLLPLAEETGIMECKTEPKEDNECNGNDNDDNNTSRIICTEGSEFIINNNENSKLSKSTPAISDRSMDASELRFASDSSLNINLSTGPAALCVEGVSTKPVERDTIELKEEPPIDDEFTITSVNPNNYSQGSKLINFNMMNKDNNLLQMNTPILLNRIIAASEVALQSENLPAISSSAYANDKRAIQYFTGIESYEKLEQIFGTFKEDWSHLIDYPSTEKHVNINKFEQFFMTLMILHRRKTFKEISMLYSVPVDQVRDIFYSWVLFMSRQWKIEFCFDKKAVKYLIVYIQEKRCFARVIIDATKPFVKKFGRDYNGNSVAQKKKVLLGIALDGSINFVSRCYDGSVSDEDILKQTQPLPLLKVDNSMNEKQHEGLKKYYSRTVVWQLTQHKMFVKPLKDTKVISNEVVFVCAMLVNFQNKR